MACPAATARKGCAGPGQAQFTARWGGFFALPNEALPAVRRGLSKVHGGSACTVSVPGDGSVANHSADGRPHDRLVRPGRHRHRSLRFGTLFPAARRDRQPAAENPSGSRAQKFFTRLLEGEIVRRDGNRMEVYGTHTAEPVNG